MSVSLILSVMLALLFLVVLFSNWGIFYFTSIKQAGSSSLIPFVGGIAGSLAMVFFPSYDFGYWSILPLLIDIGSIPIVAITIAHIVRSKYQGEKK